MAWHRVSPDMMQDEQCSTTYDIFLLKMFTLTLIKSSNVSVTTQEMQGLAEQAE